MEVDVINERDARYGHYCLSSNWCEELKEEPKEEPKLYNGKVVCVKNDGLGLTVGKIYTFVNGESKADRGNPITHRPVHDVNDLNSLFNFAKFIEVVE
jgi:hypothetical protein